MWSNPDGQCKTSNDEEANNLYRYPIGVAPGNVIPDKTKTDSVFEAGTFAYLLFHQIIPSICAILLVTFFICTLTYLFFSWLRFLYLRSKKPKKRKRKSSDLKQRKQSIRFEGDEELKKDDADSETKSATFLVRPPSQRSLIRDSNSQQATPADDPKGKEKEEVPTVAKDERKKSMDPGTATTAGTGVSSPSPDQKRPMRTKPKPKAGILKKSDQPRESDLSRYNLEFQLKRPTNIIPTSVAPKRDDNWKWKTDRPAKAKDKATIKKTFEDIQKLKSTKNLLRKYTKKALPDVSETVDEDVQPSTDQKEKEASAAVGPISSDILNKTRSRPEGVESHLKTKIPKLAPKPTYKEQFRILRNAPPPKQLLEAAKEKRKQRTSGDSDVPGGGQKDSI